MKINWCAFGIHKWIYNKAKDERHCKHCSKTMWFDDNEPELSGFAGSSIWENGKKPKK